MHILIHKSKRTLSLIKNDSVLLCVPVGLGKAPVGAKQQEGDGRTPEGRYSICLVKPNGKYGRSLGLNYPNIDDANAGLSSGIIDQSTHQAIADAHARSRRPPWGTALGGEIYIHEGGAQSDWTQGCIALNTSDMDQLFPYHGQITTVEILP